MHFLLSAALSIFVIGCSAQVGSPKARVDIRASPDVRSAVIEAVKAFGHREGFQVFSKDNLPKQGRLVSQLTLQRSDGVAISLSNFMDVNTLQTFFYAEEKSSGWHTVKDLWLREVRAVVKDHGKVVEVPIDTVEAPSKE